MRVNLQKYLLIGPTTARDDFLKKLQEMGIVEWIQKGATSLETPQEIQNFIEALHVLRKMVPVKQAPIDDYRSANVLAQHIVERNQELERLREQTRILKQEISRVEIFGNFSVAELKEIERSSKRVIQFFFCKQEAEPEATHSPEVIYIGSHHGLKYFISISFERTHYDGLIEMVIDRPLGDLQEQYAEVLRKIDDYEGELARLAHFKKLLMQGLADTLNHYHFESSKQRAELLLDGQIFAGEVWVPKTKLKQLQEVAHSFNVHAAPVQIEKEDRIPTYLENQGPARIGEDLINIYDTPSFVDRDPSLWVFIAFAIFFSMIVADAGYGLLLLALSLFLLWKFKKKGGAVKRVIKLTLYLSVGCIIWGVLATSFFGIDFAPDNKIRKISVINWMIEKKAGYFIEKKPASFSELAKEYPQIAQASTSQELLFGVTKKDEHGSRSVIYDQFSSNVLIELVIFIGALHIILSFIRYLDKNWAGFGWIIFIIGAYLYFPSVLGATSLIHYIFQVPYVEGALIGKYMVYSGLGLAWVLAIIQKRLGGLAEVMQVIQIFADVMSYLRIYALSLAGMIMASTFNRIGMSAPIIIGIFIILAGHLINITLALMGGVIHGLRLNFIEWYHYSFEGGGKKFRPLELIKIDENSNK